MALVFLCLVCLALAPAGALAAPSYYVHSAAAGRVLDVQGGSTDPGTSVQLGDLTGTPAQQWELIEAGGRYADLHHLQFLEKPTDSGDASFAGETAG